MKKIFILLIVFLLCGHAVYAQTAAKNQRWVCLQADWCLDPTAYQQGGKIVYNPDCFQSSSLWAGHRVRLTAKSDNKPLPDKDTYIVECLATSQGEICTTGNTVDDNLIYGKDNSAALNTSDGYIFQGIFNDDATTTTNPVTSRADGSISPVEWESYSNGNARKFLALNLLNDTEVGQGLGAGGQQQGTFTFDSASNISSCLSINWDPYGRVFDSQTLEPIPNVRVELQKQRSDGSFSFLSPSEILGGAITNPFTTKEDGSFSFVIPDGTYKLVPSDANYTFPNTANKLNRNYSLIYSDIYPNQTGVNIVQKGQIEHRDIPLDSLTAGGMTYPVKMMEYFYTLDKNSDTVYLEGRISHPLTKISIYSQENNSPYRLLKTIQADNNGKFSVTIDQSKFEPTEVMGDIELDKTSFINSISLNYFWKKIFPAVLAQTSPTSIKLQPILNSVNGYAYDSNQQILPMATVEVIENFSNKPYSETKADQKGYFMLDSNQLPEMPYHLRFTAATGVSTNVTLDKFVNENTQYLKNEKTAAGSGISHTINNSINNPKPSYFSNYQTPTGVVNPVVGAKTNNNSFNVVLLIASMLLIFIAVVIILFAVYLYRKNKTVS